MANPVDVSPFLQSSCVFCIHIGSPTISGTTASEGSVEGFKMIGMYICGLKRLVCLRVFRIWGLDISDVSDLFYGFELLYSSAAL